MTEFQRKITDASFLKEKQYDGSSNLRKRGNLHANYSVSEAAWFPWVFSQFDFSGVKTVLECGAGGGWLWQHNLESVPADVAVTLTDLTDGMVAELAKLADADARFSAETADIQTLPFDDNQFDMVIANHMLYHVPDIAKAVAEVRRVLKPDGTFYAVTNGAGHLQELQDVGQRLAPEAGYTAPGGRLAFNLENGEAWLRGSFETVTLRRYSSALQVTDPSAIIDYLSSVVRYDKAQRISAEAFIQQQIDDKGYYYIAKAVGMFTAKSS